MDRDLCILDVGCGTGIYLEAQVECFKDRHIVWFGLGPSREMLDYAIPKVPTAHFGRGTAERMPLRTDVFDVIYRSFAFHHRQADGLGRIRQNDETRWIPDGR